MARKMKKYEFGGEADTSYGEDERPAPTGMGDIAKVAEAAAPTNFKAAFAAARKAGDKTFTWQGKKYTTEMAGGSKPVAKPAAPKADGMSYTQRLGKDYAELEAAASRPLPANTSKAALEGLQRLRDTAKSKYEKFSESERTGKPVMKLKTGGSVSASSRGDGCATKGKTKGRMV